MSTSRPVPVLAGSALGAVLATALAGIMSSTAPAPVGSGAGPGDALVCPAQHWGTEARPQVPWSIAPSGFDPRLALTPADAATRVVVCQYEAGDTSDPAPPPRPLTRSLELTEGLEQVAADLSGAAGHDGEAGCTTMGGAVVRQLVGLEYPTGAVWVSATDEPNGCVPSSNGDFVAGGEVGDQVAKAVSDGGWLVPTQGEREVCGGTEPVGRDGVGRELVPDDPDVVLVCRVDPDVPGPSSGIFTVGRGDQERLLEALGSLPTRAAAGDLLCVDESVDRWQVVAEYGRGAPVVLDVTSGACGPGGAVSNGALEADSSDELLDLLRRVTTHG